MTTICELCCEKNPSTPCSFCANLSRDDLIETAFDRISQWKQVVIAAAIANGGQTVISTEQLLEAQTRKIEITRSMSQDIRITVIPT